MSKKKEQKTIIKTTEAVQVTTRVITQRSSTRNSVTYTSTNFGSNSSFNNNLLNVPVRNRLPSIGGTSNLTTDARPVNLNYQSPFQTSPYYRSFRGPTTSNANPYHLPLPSTVLHLPQKELDEPKEIKVKKTLIFHDRDPKNLVPTYQTHSKRRGEVLIINNIMFKEKGYRQGAKVDHKNLRSLFKQMGFNVTLDKDLKSGEMLSKMRNFSQKGALKDADIAVIVVMSHGTINESAGKTEVFGLDEKGVTVEEFLEFFKDDKCKYMAKKPKIFIFQCCRGDNEQFVQSDAQRTPHKTAAVTDTLVAYSALPGFVSHRDPTKGTWYVTALCQVFSEHAHEYNVEDLLKMVDVKLASNSATIKQTTQYDNRGFKRCFLHPV